MIDVLHLVSAKAMDYSWSSVRAFYSYIAKLVEQHRLDWNELAIIKDHSTTFSKHSDLKSPSLSTKFASTSPSHAATNTRPCSDWNYKGQCSCDSTTSSYASLHVCCVCAKDHPMLRCPKRKHPIQSSYNHCLGNYRNSFFPTHHSLKGCLLN